MANNPDIENLIQAILEGNRANALSHATDLIKSGSRPESIVLEGIEPAMVALDAKCTIDEFDLLEIMLAGRAATEVLDYLYPEGTQDSRQKGPVVLGSLEGDFHGFGKGVFKTILIANGYSVIDCGVNCSIDTIIDSAQESGALAIGISGLITQVVPLVRHVKKALEHRSLGHIEVLAGGSSLKQSTAESLNVDFLAETAFDGVRYLDKIKGGQ